MIVTRHDDSNTFPITKAQLVGNYCETLAYGVYLITCCFCARTLFWIQNGSGGQEQLKRPSEIRWIMVSVFCLLFVVNTFDDIIGLIHNIQAFVDYKGAGGAREDFTNIRDWINIARTPAHMLNMLIGDFVLIYRCYIIYARRWLVITPSFILYLACISMTIQLLNVQITTSNSAITLISNIMEPWWLAFFAITAAQNVLTTSLLIWRIWRVERQIEKFRGTKSISMSPSNQPSLRKVIRVIAESGAAYTTLVFMSFVVGICNSNSFYPLSNATLQATGITFNVIIIRSTPRREEQFTMFDQNDRRMVEQPQDSVAVRGLGELRFVSPDSSIQNGPIEIDTINQIADQD